jgi:hypothetical protein
MCVDYPRCPDCQWPLVNCKRYSGLIKKIHSKIEKLSVRSSTLSGSSVQDFLQGSKLAIKNSDLAESVSAIVKLNNDDSRRQKLAQLFVHVITLFQKLNYENNTERDKILNTIYEHVKKTNSLFLTRQQWTDFENGYNRIRLIEDFRRSKELSECDLDERTIETLDDILFGPNQFSQFACQVCTGLLKHGSEDNDYWKSILPEETKWNDFEKDRLVCDGKLFLCPGGE